MPGVAAQCEFHRPQKELASPPAFSRIRMIRRDGFKRGGLIKDICDFKTARGHLIGERPRRRYEVGKNVFGLKMRAVLKETNIYSLKSKECDEVKGFFVGQEGKREIGEGENRMPSAG